MDDIYVTYVDDEHADNNEYVDNTDDDHDDNNDSYDHDNEGTQEI